MEEKTNDFLKWYNNKDVVATLEAMQKMIEFYHNKWIDMLKLGCTLPNLANICLHKSTNYKFYPLCESDKDLCVKIRQVMTGGPSIVFTRKAVVDKTYIRNASNVCKSIVEIDASQLYHFSMCQDMPTGLYTRCEFDTDMQNLKLDTGELAVLKIWSCLSIRKQDQNVKLRAFSHLEKRKKSTVLMWTVIVLTVRQCLKQWDHFYHFCSCQEARPS